MNVCSLTEERLLEWNALVEKEPAFPMLQSWEWGNFKEELGWKVFRVAVEDGGALIAGAQLLIKILPLGLSLAYVPRGPVGSWLNARTAQLLFSELCRLARDHKAVFLKIEPPVSSDPETCGLLESCGFHQSRVTNQPQATIILDLSQGQSGILQQMRKKTRQYIHRAEREGITVRFGGSADLPAYYELMRLTGRRERFAARSLKYYQAEWEAFSADNHGALLLAYYQDQLIAARAVYYCGSHAAEFHAGSMVIPGLHPNYLLAWEAIKWAEANGCVSYDLWGIPDELANDNETQEPATAQGDNGLWGVYQFKRGFSRNVVSYIGAYDYVLAPALYFLFNSALSAGKWWERIAAVLDSLKFGPSSKLRLESNGEKK